MSEEKWKCPKCGAENAMDDNFCGECGGKKPVVGIGMAQTVNKQETVEKEGAINESTSEKPKKKSAGKIVLILAAVCVVLIVCGVVINAQNKANIAKQQKIEAEERARIAKQQKIEAEERAKIAREHEAKQRLEAAEAEAEAAKAKAEAAKAKAEAAKAQRWADKARRQEAAEAKKVEEERKKRDAEAKKAEEERKRQEAYLKGRKIGNLIWSDRAANKMNWSSAKQYCENLAEGGFGDWRLPNIYELKTLIGNGRSKLGDTSWFWSSSTSSEDPGSALFVLFDEGEVGRDDKDDDIYVRCVR